MVNTIEKCGFLNKTRKLNRNALKYIIILLMLVDHLVHWLSVCFDDQGAWYVIGRLLSRLTAPTMCFFLAEGFFYTRNVKKYVFRLGVFAVISHFAFIFFETGQWSPVSVFDGKIDVAEASYFYLSGVNKTLAFYKTSMIFTLFLGILTLSLWEKTKLHVVIKVLLTVIICAVATFGDWSYWAILYVLCFYFLRKKPVYMWITFIGISLLYVFNINLGQALSPILFAPRFYLYRIGTLLVPPVIILFYNGEVGKKSKFNKWFFYAFYPLHLVLIGIIFTYLI